MTYRHHSALDQAIRALLNDTVPHQRAEPNTQWRNTEPGILALLGTDFRVLYAPHSHAPDYKLYEDRRYLGGCDDLAHVKAVAEQLQGERAAIMDGPGGDDSVSALASGREP